MKKILTSLVLLALGAGAGWVAYWAYSPNADVRPAAYGHPKGLSDDEVDALARDIVGRMTLDEKIHEMAGDGLLRLLVPQIVRGHPLPVYAGGNEKLGIPPLAFSDGPRGVIVAPATAFPVAVARAASWDRDLERRVGDALGQEARAAGVNYFAGLCVNLLRHPSWGRAQESYGEDPYLVGEMGLALMEAVQAHNVMACAKHFALNSIENTRYDVNVTVGERALREVYLPHFKKLVDHGLASIMSAYNKVRGEYCGQNRELLTTILRDEWGFRGFVSSDWIHGLRDGEKGIHAGMDVEMPSPVHYGRNVERLIDEGRVTEDEVDAMVLRIVRTKLAFVTREDAMAYDAGILASDEHRQLAREAAEESMVLLKNEGLLPLDRDAGTVAVLGDLADTDVTGDRGSSWVRPPYRVTLLDGLRSYLGAARVLTADVAGDRQSARQAAEKADAVVVVAGFRHDEEGEYIDLDGVSPTNASEMDALLHMVGGDRYPLGLKQRDLDLIDTVTTVNERVVVVLVAGSAVTVEEWKDKVPAIVMAWLPGMEGGNALARVLFGDVNPSGKMPMTTPVDVADLPPFDPFALEVEYGLYHGYTLLDKEGKAAAFPFGFGLSYTTFELSNLRVLTPEIDPSGTLEVRVDVTNTGTVAGAEVAQLYIGFEGSPVERPKKLLRGFEKVFLDPGQTAEVAFSVPATELAWYDPETRAWQIEAMGYGVLVGPSSRDAELLRGTFTVVATSVPAGAGPSSRPDS